MGLSRAYGIWVLLIAYGIWVLFIENCSALNRLQLPYAKPLLLLCSVEQIFPPNKVLLVFWVATTLLLEMGCASVASCCCRLQWVTVSSFTVIKVVLLLLVYTFSLMVSANSSSDGLQGLVVQNEVNSIKIGEKQVKCSKIYKQNETSNIVG